jgi:thiamine kinase-like enzyme
MILSKRERLLDMYAHLLILNPQVVKELVFSHQDLLCGNILFNPEWYAFAINDR